MKQNIVMNQVCLFEVLGFNENNNLSNHNSLMITNTDKFYRLNNLKFENYTFDDYKHDVLNIGLKQTWESINNYVLNNEIKNKFLSIENFAELYEIGLALQNKKFKKDFGQYYTPNDVATVMAEWLVKQNGENICDIGCGTGKLILAYLDLIGEKKAIELICAGKLYLYDIDDVALSICKTILLIKYGKNIEPYLHIFNCDFLSKNVLLPKNCKVISNPPYSCINTILPDWDNTEIAVKTKELYSMFMEKIIKQSESSVLITPYSFIGGNKFYSLRNMLNGYNGFIISFDNVPGNIFYGKKYGVFNSNKTNSVRAAITVVENNNELKGFKLTPLIRFNNREREELLKINVLESFINHENQIITEENPKYCKCAKELNQIWKIWKKSSVKKLGDYINSHSQYTLSIPNTCRYFTTASNCKINRRGQIVVAIEDYNIFNYVFCLINSSFAYWYWRMFDGGITYSKSLLLSMPVFFEKLKDEEIKFFNDTAKEMINNTDKFLTTKNNMGIQENIKYPKKYRDKINRKLLDILGINSDEKIFDIIHSNVALEVKK